MTENSTKQNHLITLKILIFLFFGAIQCVYVYLPNHMEWLGFSLNDTRNITAIASLVSVICPIILGIILDRLAIKRPGNYGKWLRVSLFICYILAGIFFALLYFIPQEPKTLKGNKLDVFFSCNDNGGYISEKRLNDECDVHAGHSGNIKLLDCDYTCKPPNSVSMAYLPDHLKKTSPFEKIQLGPEVLSEGPSQEEDYDENASYNEENLPLSGALTAAPTDAPIIPPPHICIKNASNINCHVYLRNITKFINLDVETIEDTGIVNEFSQTRCKHSLASISCNIPERQITWMRLQRKIYNETHECIPAIDCNIGESFGGKNLLNIFYEVPYTSYTTLRIIAEIFPILIHMILNIMIIVATRETSTGRGNVGHQLAFYPMGVLVFGSILGITNHLHALEPFFIPIITFCCTMFVSAFVVLFSGSLPLTPSDWWWHTKCGMLAIPMSALKRFKWVIVAITIIAFILGGLWHVQEAYRHINIIDIIEYAIIDNLKWRSKTFVYVIGALLAIPLIWNGEKIVDCIGHSNIFILSLVSFAFRFTGIYLYIGNPYTTFLEILEPLSFYLTWLALLLFIRHLIPKNILALGQGLLVVLYFALGRAFGFYFAVSDFKYTNYKDLSDSAKELTQADLIQSKETNHENIYSVAAAIACATAVVYFIIYHLILLPKYRVPINRLVSNDQNNMSPQHVFHDERSRKGYFRY
ncbi:CLUMA_CG020920, isoform A [Clunio marinus]|uniref:CLUMA_CG020920, isoform A n=1 Tax=Clunio marinus TaxID=568069 RepID=A0A1J1J6S6_9DIPT|nr:CLUMA_CG020920, isoform A [Clunio marinus]